MDNGCFHKNNNCSFLSGDRVKTPIRKEALTDFYVVEQRPFARGKFASVRRCRHNETGVDYAAKFIRKRRRAADVRHEIMHEIAILEACKFCDHIVHLHEVYETPSEFVLVLELASGGEIQRLIDEDEVIPEKDVCRMMRQILEGLTFLHDRNIAHLDLKPQNLLLTSSYPHCDVRLCDFGISRVISKGVELREIMGTPDYVAPEILNYEPINLKTDMWSVGVLAYVLLTGHAPFAGDSKQETYFNITQVTLEFPDELFYNVSTHAKDFIRKLLVLDANTRMGTRDCLNHPWLKLEVDNNTNNANCCSGSPTVAQLNNSMVKSSPSLPSSIPLPLPIPMPLTPQLVRVQFPTSPLMSNREPSSCMSDKENFNLDQQPLSRSKKFLIMEEAVVC